MSNPTWLKISNNFPLNVWNHPKDIPTEDYKSYWDAYTVRQTTRLPGEIKNLWYLNNKIYFYLIEEHFSNYNPNVSLIPDFWAHNLRSFNLATGAFTLEYQFLEEKENELSDSKILLFYNSFLCLGNLYDITDISDGLEPFPSYYFGYNGICKLKKFDLTSKQYIDITIDYEDETFQNISDATFIDFYENVIYLYCETYNETLEDWQSFYALIDISTLKVSFSIPLNNFPEDWYEYDTNKSLRYLNNNKIYTVVNGYTLIYSLDTQLYSIIEWPTSLPLPIDEIYNDNSFCNILEKARFYPPFEEYWMVRKSAGSILFYENGCSKYLNTNYQWYSEEQIIDESTAARNRIYRYNLESNTLVQLLEKEGETFRASAVVADNSGYFYFIDSAKFKPFNKRDFYHTPNIWSPYIGWGIFSYEGITRCEIEVDTTVVDPPPPPPPIDPVDEEENKFWYPNPYITQGRKLNYFPRKTINCLIPNYKISLSGFLQSYSKFIINYGGFYNKNSCEFVCPCIWESNEEGKDSDVKTFRVINDSEETMLDVHLSKTNVLIPQFDINSLNCLYQIGTFSLSPTYEKINLKFEWADEECSKLNIFTERGEIKEFSNIYDITSETIFYKGEGIPYNNHLFMFDIGTQYSGIAFSFNKTSNIDPTQTTQDFFIESGKNLWQMKKSSDLIFTERDILKFGDMEPNTYVDVDIKCLNLQNTAEKNQYCLLNLINQKECLSQILRLKPYKTSLIENEGYFQDTVNSNLLSIIKSFIIEDKSVFDDMGIFFS